MDPRFTLEKRIAAELKSYDGHMCFYADDLKGNVVAIGPDEDFETASTIKTYILACLFDQIKQGKADLNDTLIYKENHCVSGSGLVHSLDFGASLRVKDAATWMIIVSDNAATNMIIEYLGIDTINACIQKLGCTSTKLHRYLHFDGENMGRLGTSTPRDYASIFVRLAKHQLIGPEEDAAMIEIFKQQHYNSMIVRDFPVYYMDGEDNGEETSIQVASKSGSMDACRNDGGIVYTPYGPYVIVMMHKNFSDPMYYANHPATRFGAKVSRMMLDQFLALEGRFVL